MSATTIAVTTSDQTLRGAPTDALDVTYIQAVMELLRSWVDPVPGSGPLRGLWYYSGIYYAFRDDPLGVSCKMHKASSSTEGWEEVSTGVTLLPGGRYEFINYNFLGHAGAKNMYGVDGVNKGFQFDGTTFTQITTGMTTDAPAHLTAYKKHLFYSFSGGSVQHSGTGDPTTWTPITGAGEIATGDDITGFTTSPGKALFIMCRNSSFVLKGSSASDWDLDLVNDEAGAIEWSIQRFNYPLYLDDRGVASLDSVQEYGDFYVSKKSQKIQRALRLLKNTLLSSLKVREKDQYRLYFDNMTVLTFSFYGDKLIGISSAVLDTKIRTAHSVEDENGEELLLVGCCSGYAYRMDSGYNFDGAEVDAWLRLAFNHFKSPEYEKRFFKTVLEIDADESTELSFLPSFNYDSPELPPASVESEVSVLGGGAWWDNPDARWEHFHFDSQSVDSAYGYTEGIGTNFGLFIRSVSTYTMPHTIQGAIIHYSRKGVKR